MLPASKYKLFSGQRARSLDAQVRRCFLAPGLPVEFQPGGWKQEGSAWTVAPRAAPWDSAVTQTLPNYSIKGKDF